MTLDKYIEDIKFLLTGNAIDLEIDDEAIGKAVQLSLAEIQRYTNEFRLVETEFKSCIDLKAIGIDCYAVANVYRTFSTTSLNNQGGVMDPMYLQFWLSFGLGTTYNLNNYLLNFASYNTLQQIRNTMSTDLAFKEDAYEKKLYINSSTGDPGRIVIEFIPIYKDVDDVKDAYWIDLLKRLALANTKVVLGRIRTQITSSNSHITLDGETILAEGLAEQEKLREELESNTDMFLPID